MCEECNEQINIYEVLENAPYDIETIKGEFEKSVNKIKQVINKTSQDFLIIGQELKKIKDNQLYKQRFATFEMAVSLLFGMARDVAYRYIKIAELVECGDVATNSDKPYSFCQLQEMASIDRNKDIDLLKRINSTMTVATIRQIKKDYYASQQLKEQEKNKEMREELKQLALKNHEETKKQFFEELEQAQAIVENNEIEPLVLKNKNERQNFLKNYSEWSLIANVQSIGLKIFERKFKNKTSILAFQANCLNEGKLQDRPSVKYVIFQQPDCKLNLGYQYGNGYSQLNLWFNAESWVIDYLTKYKKEIE